MEVGGAAIESSARRRNPAARRHGLRMPFGAAAACELSACFLRDVAAAIEAVPDMLGRRGYGVYAPAGTEGIMRQLLPPGFGLLLQAGDDLGHVLIGATRAFLSARHDCMLLVNGDSPTLPPRLLTQAIEILRQPGDHMVLGPASDGGYYLIGPEASASATFERIAWGTDSVGARYLRARRRNRACHHAARRVVRCRRPPDLALAAGGAARPFDPLSWRRICRGEPRLPQGYAADKCLSADAGRPPKWLV